MNKADIKSLDFGQLSEVLQEMGQKKFRATQIYQWLHQKLITDFDQMTNVAADLREQLKSKYELNTLEVVQVLTSEIDGTSKFLFRLYDGNVVESVLMKYKHGNSVCISTQVGCRMGCRFCASTLDGLERNLEVHEMLEEVYRIQAITGEKVSNIVLMGSGEPLDNYDNVIKFLGMITDEYGLNISQRNITLSTCGIVPKIRELAELKLQITLAISLHASDNETRKGLMPVANKYSIEEILDACRYYFDMTGRRISFEYSLVAGVNDSREEAIKLAGILKGINCHVNLIPVNPIKERDYKQTIKKDVENFKNYLEKYRINVTIRREMGRDIQGACGQLRKSYYDKEKAEKILKEKEGENESIC
ncbi:MAG: 23S rRNA (adenine(2503)-C(2))-methyltransferase RlmN [Lachnospiraceae bacterium]|nr:23S rRNA (adenine(2503)-C(2))-methyltransferase RlmN [Lachnospiraceae bacterium]